MADDTRLILAIETSNPSMGTPGVALGRATDTGVELLGVEQLRAIARQGDDLAPAIDRLFASVGADRHDLARVLVSVGPGGFTALRIAVACAKMLSEFLGAELVAVPSALVVAATLARDDAPTLVCLASKGQTTFGVVFGPEQWTESPTSLGILDADALEGVGARTIAADEHLASSIRDRASELGIRIVAPSLDASALLRVGHAMAPTDPLELAPLYPREPEAVRKWRELHPRS